MQNRTVAGIFFLCLGVFVFSIQDAIIKAVSGDYPLTQVVATRCIVSLPILAIFVHYETGLRAIVSSNFWQLTSRSLIMLLAYTTYYMAFPALPLADAVALYFTVPLFMVALAVPYLGEKIGWRRLVAVLIGLVGVVVMLRPGAGLFEPAALLSLFSAATYGMSMLMARKLGTAETASVMAFYQNWVYLAGAVIVAMIFQVSGTTSAAHPSVEFLVRPWVWPRLEDFLLQACCGFIAAIGMICLTHAYRIAHASIVTSFEYTGILWAPLWGYLFFAEMPMATTFIGAGLIVIAGMFALAAARRTAVAEPEATAKGV